MILAGDPAIVARFRSTLPDHLAMELIDIKTKCAEHLITNAVAIGLCSLIKCTSRKSLSITDELEREICANGLVAVGASACLKTLKEGLADALVMSPTYPPEPGWMCAVCGHTEAGESALSSL